MFSSSIRLLAFATFSLAPVASAAPTLQVRAASRNGFPALVDDGPNSEYQACMLAITNLPPIIDANGKPTEIGGANDRCVKGCRPGIFVHINKSNAMQLKSVYELYDCKSTCTDSTVVGSVDCGTVPSWIPT